MHTKFTLSLMVLKIVSNKSQVMLPQFPQELKANATIYIKVLDRLV